MNKEKALKGIPKIMILGIIGFALVFTVIPRVKNINELSSRKESLEKKRAELYVRNEQLEKELENVESLDTVERIAREKLGLVKEGEKYVMTVIPGEIKEEK